MAVTFIATAFEERGDLLFEECDVALSSRGTSCAQVTAQIRAVAMKVA
jgi:hypothetical protein